MGVNENFVQRYDCLIDPVDLKVRYLLRTKVILLKEINSILAKSYNI